MPPRSDARPTWKGSLKLSLITIPIRVFLATNPSSDVSFRQVHRKCHTRIQLKKWCPHCEREVTSDEIVKGYESAKGKFILVEEEDIKRVRPESTHVIEISHVLSTATIDPVYIERAYYLAPDTKTAGAPFAVFREALGDQAAIGRLALHGREYLVAVVPRDDALMLFTLRTAGEVRQLNAVGGLDFANVRVKPDELKLARQVLASFESTADLSSFTDNYQKALREMLASKGKAEVVEQAEATPGKGKGKVVNLMDALRRSLESVSETRKKPAKVTKMPARKAQRRKAS